MPHPGGIQYGYDRETGWQMPSFSCINEQALILPCSQGLVGTPEVRPREGWGRMSLFIFQRHRCSQLMTSVVTL